MIAILSKIIGLPSYLLIFLFGVSCALLFIYIFLRVFVLNNVVSENADQTLRSLIPKDVNHPLMKSQDLQAMDTSAAKVEKLENRITELEAKTKKDAEIIEQYKQIHNISLGDKNAIKKLVIICGVVCRRVTEGRKPAHLDFAFAILNMSLLKISVDSIGGHILYYEDGSAYTPKLEPRLEINQAHNLGFRQTGHIVVQQNFQTEAEANYLLNGPIDTIFLLKTLNINVTGEGLESTSLDADIGVKKDEIWFNHNESYFFSSGMAAQNARAELENLKAQYDLLYEKGSKESQKCANNIKEISIAYGKVEKLHDLLNRQNAKPFPISVLECLSAEIYSYLGLCSKDSGITVKGSCPELPANSDLIDEQRKWLKDCSLKLLQLIQEQRQKLSTALEITIKDK